MAKPRHLQRCHRRGRLRLLRHSAALTAAIAWLPPGSSTPENTLHLRAAAHLATWSISAPVAAGSAAATTAVAVQADLAGVALIAAAALKIVTVVIELAGTGTRTGWNAGGWAAGTSGYATVIWLAVLLIELS